MTIFDNEPLFNLDAVEEKAGASDVAAAGGAATGLEGPATLLRATLRSCPITELAIFIRCSLSKVRGLAVDFMWHTRMS